MGSTSVAGSLVVGKVKVNPWAFEGAGIPRRGAL